MLVGARSGEEQRSTHSRVDEFFPHGGWGGVADERRRDRDGRELHGKAGIGNCCLWLVGGSLTPLSEPPNHPREPRSARAPVRHAQNPSSARRRAGSIFSRVPAHRQGRPRGLGTCHRCRRVAGRRGVRCLFWRVRARAMLRAFPLHHPRPARPPLPAPMSQDHLFSAFKRPREVPPHRPVAFPC